MKNKITSKHFHVINFKKILNEKFILVVNIKCVKTKNIYLIFFYRRRIFA
jgi:hypothetical protein